MRRRPFNPRETGFGLAELMISLGLSTLLLASAWQFVARQGSTSQREERNSSRVSEIERVAEKLRREIRFAPRVQGSPGVAFGIEAIPKRSFDSSANAMVRADDDVDAIRILVREPMTDASPRLAADMVSASGPLQLDDAAGVTMGSAWVVTGNVVSGGLVAADLVRVASVSGNNISAENTLSRIYFRPAPLFPVSIVEYGLDRTDPKKPRLLVRKNGGAYQVASEGVTELQFWYRCHDGNYNPVQGGPTLIAFPACAGNDICRDLTNAGANPTVLGQIYDVTVRLVGNVAKVDGTSHVAVVERSTALRNFSFGQIADATSAP